MQKQVYVPKHGIVASRTINSVKTASIPAIKPVEPPVVAPSRARRAKLTGIVMLTLCFLLAIGSVLLVPMLASGAVPVSAATKGVTAMQFVKESTAEVAKTEYTTLEQAKQAAGFDAVLPASLAGKAVAYRVLDAGVLEVEYKLDKNTVFVRTAPGNEDVSMNQKDYAFTVTEEVGGVTRSYAGATENKLSLAVWADAGNSFAVVADGGLDAEVVRQIAEEIA